MPELENWTISLSTESAVVVKGAVAEGDYSSSSEVISEALRDWKMKRELQLQNYAAFKADIVRGMADVAEGRVAEFNIERIVERGKELSAARRSSV